jgi:hypothetical protein
MRSIRCGHGDAAERLLQEQLKDSHKLNSLNTMIQKGIVQYNQIEASLDDCGSEDEEEPFCSIAVTCRIVN